MSLIATRRRTRPGPLRTRPDARRPDALGIRRLSAQRLRDEGAGDVRPPTSASAAARRAAQQSDRDRDRRPPTSSTTNCRRAFFQLLPGQAPEVLQLLLRHRQRRPGRRRRGHADAVRRARRTGRRPAHPGARLRLGLADAVDGRAVSRMRASPACPTPAPQREYIEARCRERGLGNVQIITCDVNRLELDPKATFDRCVSIEMFEHMRNYEHLLGASPRWLKPGGKLFVHIFCHREPDVPVRDRGRGQLDGHATSSPAA